MQRRWDSSLGTCPTRTSEPSLLSFPSLYKPTAKSSQASASSVNLNDEAEMESDQVKVISDDSGSDTEDIDIEH